MPYLNLRQRPTKIENCDISVQNMKSANEKFNTKYISDIFNSNNYSNNYIYIYIYIVNKKKPNKKQKKLTNSELCHSGRPQSEN